MTSNTTKTVCSVLLLMVAVVVVGSARTGRLWPWISVGIVVSSVSLLVSAGRLRTNVFILLAVAFGVGYRLLIFSFPASYIGLDPDRAASAVAHIVTTGTVMSISDYNFYSSAPLFHLFSSEIAVITDLPVRFSMGIPTAMFGLIGPLVVVTFVRRFAPSTFAHRAAKVGAAVAAVGVATWRFGYFPIPQTEAALIWGIFLLTLLRLCEMPDSRDLVVLLVCLLGLMFSHKLGVLIAVAAFAGIVAVNEFVRITRQTEPHGLSRVLRIGLAISVSFFLVQFVWVTQYIRSLLYGIVAPILQGGVEVVPPNPTFSAATPLLSGASGAVTQNIGWLFLAGAAAVSFFVLWWHIPDRGAPVIGMTLAVAGFFGVSLATSVFSVQRILLISEWLFVVVAVTGTSWAAHRLSRLSDHRISASAVVVLFATLLVCSQAVTTTVDPDAPTSYRQYLTEEEVTAKDTITTSAPQVVATDAYYAHELTPKNVETGTAPYITGQASGSPGMKPMPGLLNASFSDNLISVRQGVNTVRGPNEAMRLQYNPVARLSGSENYSQVYTSDTVYLFRST